MRVHATILSLALATFAMTTPAQHDSRQVQLCEREFCYPAFQSCIQDCDSPRSADWWVLSSPIYHTPLLELTKPSHSFDVYTSPSCEACTVKLVNCPVWKSVKGTDAVNLLSFGPEVTWRRERLRTPVRL